MANNWLLTIDELHTANKCPDRWKCNDCSTFEDCSRVIEAQHSKTLEWLEKQFGITELLEMAVAHSVTILPGTSINAKAKLAEYCHHLHITGAELLKGEK